MRRRGAECERERRNPDCRERPGFLLSGRRSPARACPRRLADRFFPVAVVLVVLRADPSSHWVSTRPMLLPSPSSSSASSTACCGVAPARTTSTTCPTTDASARDSLVSSNGGESNSTMRLGSRAPSFATTAGHARAGEQFGGRVGRPARRQDRPGPARRWAGSPIPRRRVRRAARRAVPARPPRPSTRLMCGLATSASTSSTRDVLLERQREREIEAGESLAITGQRAGQHDRRGRWAHAPRRARRRWRSAAA